MGQTAEQKENFDRLTLEWAKQLFGEEYAKKIWNEYKEKQNEQRFPKDSKDKSDG